MKRFYAMFEDSMQHGLDKRAVARAFNAAADDYATASALQQEVERRMLERLDIMNIDPRRIADIGAGPGCAARAMAKRYRRARVTSIDIAPNMLLLARKKAPRFFSRHEYVCADAEALPLASGVVDLLFTNLTLQWCNDLDAAITELARVAAPGALIMLSTVGPDTLRELRDSWAAADDGVHTNDFIDMHDIGDAMMRAGLADPVLDVENFTLTYDSVRSIMRELKTLGAHNVRRERRRTLTGKGRLQEVESHYEQLRTDGVLPVSYEIIYGHAWKNKDSERGRRDPGIGVRVETN